MASLTVTPSGSGPPATASVDAIADRLTLDPFTAALTASAAPSAYLWTVTGQATIAASTTATPTITPTGPGYVGVQCVATIAGNSTVATPGSLLIGDGLPRDRTITGPIAATVYGA